MSPASPEPGQAGKPRRPRKDWCRNAEWTPLAREKFFLRLSSVADTVKYLRRKADYLLADHPDGARELLELALSQARSRGQQVGTRRDLARAELRCGRPAVAVQAWRAALDAAGDDTLWIQTAVEYLACVTACQQVDHYADAARVARQLDEQLLDPVQRFLWHAARAVLADAGGDALQARLDAGSALDAHRQFAAQAREFPEAGVTGERATGLYLRLFTLAGSALPT